MWQNVVFIRADAFYYDRVPPVRCSLFDFGIVICEKKVIEVVFVRSSLERSSAITQPSGRHVNVKAHVPGTRPLSSVNNTQPIYVDRHFVCGQPLRVFCCLTVFPVKSFSSKDLLLYNV